jgi:hypothetical protein
MDFQSLSKLSEKAYCDKLVILTSDIVDRYFNDTEVTFLEQRIKGGLEVNDLKKENVRYINKDSLESLDVSNDFQKSIRKKRICIGIAKFYVKIAHIFAAIVMTINPVYTYKDVNGQTVKTSLLEKDKIPKNVNRKLFKLNICDNRIRALKKGEYLDEKTGNVTIKPRVCDINTGDDGSLKTLENEPGIPELLRLYLDDKYDYSNGSFLGMTEQTEKQFRKDLKLFYTAFTGNEEMPDTIKKFSDIKLRDYNKKPGCQPPNSVLKGVYTLNKKDELFVKYADNIKSMIQSAADNQYKLLEVINDLFTYVNDPYTGKRVIRINPKLTDELLQKAVEKTRKLIVNLYVKCETDYVNGVQIFEAIVESKIYQTTQKQIETLKKEATKIIEETKKASEPVEQNIIDKPLVPNQTPNKEPYMRPSFGKPVLSIEPLPVQNSPNVRNMQNMQNVEPLPVRNMQNMQNVEPLPVRNNPNVRNMQNVEPLPVRNNPNVRNMQNMQNVEPLTVQNMQNVEPLPVQNMQNMQNVEPLPVRNNPNVRNMQNVEPLPVQNMQNMQNVQPPLLVQNMQNNPSVRSVEPPSLQNNPNMQNNLMV